MFDVDCWCGIMLIVGVALTGWVFVVPSLTSNTCTQDVVMCVLQLALCHVVLMYVLCLYCRQCSTHSFVYYLHMLEALLLLRGLIFFHAAMMSAKVNFVGTTASQNRNPVINSLPRSCCCSCFCSCFCFCFCFLSCFRFLPDMSLNT